MQKKFRLFDELVHDMMREFERINVKDTLSVDHANYW